jgi:hypothetical protein
VRNEAQHDRHGTTTVGVRSSPQPTAWSCKPIMRYQRADGTYFFTVNLAERGRRLLMDHIDVLRASVKT